MKRLFFLFAILSPLFAGAQVGGTFTIKGKAGNLNAPAQVYLLYQLGANKIADSSAVVNGDFSFTGNTLFPVNAFLVMDHKGVGMSKLEEATADVFTFFLDKGEITITTPDSIAKAKITGSLINEENTKLLGQIKAIEAEAQKLNAEIQAAPAAKQNSNEYQTEMQAKFKVLQNEHQSALQTFIVMHPNSYLSIIALNTLDSKTDPFESDNLYNVLSADLKATEAAKVLKASIDRAKLSAVGAMAPDFTQNDTRGLPVKLSMFKGKYLLIDFWASWCGPCRQASPTMVRLFNKYKTRNFNILGVSLDRPGAKADWLAAIKNDGLVWTQVSDLKFWENSAAQLYSVTAIPSNFLLDPEGKIIARDLRGVDLENKLAEVLGK
ncbi:TlpA disulfide reductase family protein [Mucilaginibacter puniceus]